jgi:uncharacterized protein YbaR (Trm112 family)
MVVLQRSTSHVTDVQFYSELKGILDEVREERLSSAPDFSDVRKRAEIARASMVPVLRETASTQAPIKQKLLFAVRDELPRMMNGDLKTESRAEKAFAAFLHEVAAGLGVHSSRE